MSFTCPHYDELKKRCRKLSRPCVPGQKGCVMAGKVRIETRDEQGGDT